MNITTEISGAELTSKRHIFEKYFAKGELDQILKPTDGAYRLTIERIRSEPIADKTQVITQKPPLTEEQKLYGDWVKPK